MFFTILGWVGLFFGGLLLGMFIILLIKVKKARKTIFKNVKKGNDRLCYKNKQIEEIIKPKLKNYKKKNRFHVFKTVLGFSPKTKGYFQMYGEIIKEVANLQNPESKSPFLEFTIKQAFDFIDNVTVDLEDVLDALDMPMLSNLDLSTIYGFVDLKNKIDQIKVVKAAKKISKPIKPIVKIFKMLNPIRWVSLLITAIFIASLKRDLIFAFADIVAFEFANFYEQCKNENVLLQAN